MLRHDRRYEGKTSWTATHERELARISFDQPAQNIAFAEYRLAIGDSDARVKRLIQALAHAVEQWRMQPVVHAVMTLRGLDMMGATTVVAELGDLKRFTRPRGLMGYLGLVPSEHTSGGKRRLGAITKRSSEPSPTDVSARRNCWSATASAVRP